MKIVAIGDIHGRGHWQKIIAAHPDADKFVFVGDYWDSYDIPYAEQRSNFLALIHQKLSHPELYDLLLGNHDAHYTHLWMMVGESYTGHQGAKGWDIRLMLEEHKELFQMASLYDGFLFTHAGVTSTWMKATMMLMEDDGFELFGIPVDEYINQVWKASPRYFLFSGTDGYGDDVTQSPIWVRPASLMRNAYKYETLKQVVGHTSQHTVKIQKDRYFFIDTLGFSGDYLVIQDGVPSVHKL